MVLRRRRPRRSGADRRRGEAARRFRRAVPAGDRRQLSRSAPRRQRRRGPVRRARGAAPGLHGDSGSRRRSSGRRRPPPAVRQPDPVAAAGATGVPPPAAVSGRPRRQRHAAHRRRGGRRRAVRRGARDHHAPRVVLAKAAQRAGRGAAGDLRRRPRRTRGSGSIIDTSGGPFHTHLRPAATIITGDFNLEHGRSAARADAGALRRRHVAARRRVGASSTRGAAHPSTF